ncbi:hypothetical protein Tco_1272850 [Tanacetum coccineum]
MLAIPHLSQVSSMAEIDSKEAQMKLKAGICLRIPSHNKHTSFLSLQRNTEDRIVSLKVVCITFSVSTVSSFDKTVRIITSNKTGDQKLSGHMLQPQLEERFMLEIYQNATGVQRNNHGRVIKSSCDVKE